jgi:hypothetical protein
MKALLLILALFPSLSFADASVPRSKQYLWTVYDVANGGGVGTHNLGVSLPKGAVITAEWVYINTQFASGGTESLSFGCGGTDNLLWPNSVKNITMNSYLNAHLGTTAFGAGGVASVIGANIVVNGGSGSLSSYGSVPSACQVYAKVATSPYTAGKATLIIEYFKL